jgi:hypothetical protein
VHAPSTDHAVTAAVLRSGFLNRPLDSPKTFAINLSSARVRLALEMLDGVRSGQELGALLGYRFERALRDEALSGREARRHLAPLRAAYPMVAGKLNPAPSFGAQGLPARDVVDGLAMWRAPSPFAALQNVTAVEQAALTNALASVRDALDGVADLLVAESVHQLTGGRPDASGASLDSLAAGARPPEPSIARSPRQGAEVHVRAIVLLDLALPMAAGWPASATPRARAQSELDAWLGELIGDARSISCTVSWPGTGGAATVATVTLAQLGLRPIDLVALGTDSAAAGAANELDLRLLTAAGAPWAVGRWHQATIDLASAGAATDDSIADVLELVRLIQRVLAGSRSLGVGDLQHPSSGGAAAGAAGALTARASAARSDFAAARHALQVVLDAARTANTPTASQLEALAAGMRDCALWGVSGAFGPPMTADDLVRKAASVGAEMDARLAAADPGDPAAALTALFGRSLPLFDVTPLAPSLRDELVASLDAALVDADTMRGWTAQAARARGPLDRWRRLGLVATALRRPFPAAEAAQTPFAPGDPWGGIARPPGSPLSLVVARADALRGAASLCGFVLDEWQETIPRATASTAIAYHYDAPSAEAPQAVLIVVPPDVAAPRWIADVVVGAVQQTIDMAAWRGVDLEALPTLAPLLPAATIAANASGDTAAIRFDNLLRGNEV